MSLQSKGADDGDGANENDRDDGDKEEVENERILYHLLDSDCFHTYEEKGCFTNGSFTNLMILIIQNIEMPALL